MARSSATTGWWPHERRCTTARPEQAAAADILTVGSIGLRTRKLPALSAVGVAIDIASMVAVLGISASSQADLLHQTDALGTTC